MAILRNSPGLLSVATLLQSLEKNEPAKAEGRFERTVVSRAQTPDVATAAGDTASEVASRNHSARESAKLIGIPVSALVYLRKVRHYEVKNKSSRIATFHRSDALDLKNKLLALGQPAGYSHILLLSHHFGNRHLGRASERHAPHGTREFLDDAAQKFPGVHLYPIRRDIFPATRLRERNSGESAFEVVSFDDHQKMYFEGSADVLRSLQPIYTFATLNVVGREMRPQSGFCTYFFDVETRLENLGLNESIRQNILGFGAGKPAHDSLVSMLRAVHFMESEKPIGGKTLLPVLDPFEWAMPTTTAAAGEVEIMTRRGKGSVLLCLPATLAQATKVLHKEAQ